MTLAALAALRALQDIPISGLDFALLPDLDAEATYRLSIAAVAPTAWLSAVALGELAKLIFPLPMLRTEARRCHADPFAVPLVALALVLSGIQAAGIASALENIPELVPEPGTTFRFATVATLVGGTALTIAIAGIISTAGIASGFWVFLAASAAYDFIPALLPVYLRTEIGLTPVRLALLQVFVLLVCIAAVVALILARNRMGHRRGEPVVWPLLLAGLLKQNIGALFAFLAEAVYGDILPVVMFAPDRPLGLGITVLLIAAITWRYAKREQSLLLAVPTGVLLAAIATLDAWARNDAHAMDLAASEPVLVATVAAVIAIGLNNGRSQSDPS